jgi:hypothetical protein
MNNISFWYCNKYIQTKEKIKEERHWVLEMRKMKMEP